MGNLKFGNNAPLALYMGVSGATKAYYGTEVVFGGEPTPIDYSKEYGVKSAIRHILDKTILKIRTMKR